MKKNTVKCLITYHRTHAPVLSWETTAKQGTWKGARWCCGLMAPSGRRAGLLSEKRGRNWGVQAQGVWRPVTTPNLKDNYNWKQLLTTLSAISTCSEESLLCSVLWCKKSLSWKQNNFIIPSYLGDLRPKEHKTENQRSMSCFSFFFLPPSTLLWAEYSDLISFLQGLRTCIPQEIILH